MKACSRFCQSLFCCHSCPGVKTSMSPKIIILVLLYCNFIFHLLMILNITPVTFDMFIFCSDELDKFCRLHSQIIVIYRASLALYLFFGFMAITTHRIKSSRDDRSPIHNGCWFPKLLFLAAITTGCLFIPPGYFDFVFSIFGAIHSITFIVFELVTLLSLSYKIACFFLKPSGNCPFCNYLPLVTVLFAMIVMSLLYTSFVLEKFLKDDQTVLSIVVFNIVASYLLLFGHLIFIIVLGLKCMLLQGGVLCCQVVYFSTFALFHSPFNDRLSDLSKHTFDIVNYFGMSVAVIVVVIFTIIDVYKPEIITNAVIHVETRGKEICGIWGKPRIVNVIWPENSNGGSYPKIPADMSGQRAVFVSVDKNDDEYNKVRYKWRDFYIICNHLTMFMMMSLTKWKFPRIENGALNYEERNPVALWANLASCWFCYATFVMMFVFQHKYYE